MSFIYRRPWDSQPQIAVDVDESHPLAGVLVDAWIGSAPLLNRGATISASGIGYAAGSNGIAATFGSYGSSTAIVNLPNTNRSRLVGVNGSLVVGLKFGTVANETFPNFWTVRNGSTVHAIFLAGLDATTYSGGRIATNINGVDHIGASGSLRQNEFAVYGAQWGSAGRKLFVNGVLNSTSASTAVVPSSTIQPALGNRQSGGRSIGAGSELYFAFTFSENIGDAWHAALAADPWQLFEPRRIIIPVASAGGTATITPTLIASTATFGTATVVRSAVATVTPSRIASTATAGAHTVTRSAVAAVTATRIESTATFGTATVARSAVAAVSPARIESTATIGSHAVAPIGLGTVAPARIESTAAVNAPSISYVSVRAVTATRIESTATIGAATVARSAVASITPGRIDSAATFGVPVVSGSGVAQIVVGRIASTVTFGTASVVRTGSGTGADAAEIWGYVLSNGKTAEQTLVELHAALVGGRLAADVRAVNGVTVTGTGVAGDYWGPA